MSYHHSALRRYGARSHAGHAHAAMGGFDWNIPNVLAALTGGQVAVDTLETVRDKLGNETVTKCLAQSKADPQIKAIDAALTEIAKNWSPDGLYSPDQVMQIISVVNASALQGMAAIMAAPVQFVADGESAKLAFSSKIEARIAESATYTAAAAEARRVGAKAVKTADLKFWVTNTLNETASAMQAAFVLTCSKTLLDQLASIVDRVKAFLMSLVQVVIDVGEMIVSIPSTISTMMTVIKWGALAGAGFWVYLQVQKRRKQK